MTPPGFRGLAPQTTRSPPKKKKYFTFGLVLRWGYKQE